MEEENKEQSPKSPIGPVLSIIIILALLIIGSIYFLQQKIQQIKNSNPQTATSTEEVSSSTPDVPQNQDDGSDLFN
jgi:uncharacterized protein YxeA